MKILGKSMIGAAAAALVAVSAAAPAEARHRYYDRDHGIDAGDVIAGVAVVGGIAAIASAIGNSNRYGYGAGYGGYGYGSTGGYGQGAAVNACAYQAQRYGGGRVQIIDVDQTGARRFRVHGVIGGQGGYYGGYDRQVGFTCTARDNGRVTRFNTNRY